MAGLVENPQRYAGGVTAVIISSDQASLEIVVDDEGPGNAVDERRAIRGAPLPCAARGHGAFTDR